MPQVDLELAPRIFAAVHTAIVQGLIRSCHDLSEGGLAAAIAEMAFAGEFGVDVSLLMLSDVSELSDEVLLFSESNTRFVMEVEPDRRSEFEALFFGLPLFVLGEVTVEETVRISDAAGQTLIAESWRDLKAVWQQPLQWD
ncbi:MAG: hypothetical protein IID45_08260 [Planctomycetes bacterium]|nr:hypothetical protein [Planctomycetota bacterium]